MGSIRRELVESALLALQEEWWGLSAPRSLLAATLLERGVCESVPECRALVEHLVSAGYLVFDGSPADPPEAREVAWTQEGWVAAHRLLGWWRG